MNVWVNNIKLEGEKVQLIPLEMSYRDELLKAASDGKLWELWFTCVPSIDTIDEYIEHALNQKHKGSEYPFVVVDKNKCEIIGSTRYTNIQPEHKRLEIGYTWYAEKHQRTGVNTESKLLLLKYAFENLGCIAVQFMTNWYNLRSRTALSRLGAKQDGILRNHKINADGSYRDTVVYSITNQDWSGVKNTLEYHIKRHKDTAKDGSIIPMKIKL